MNFIEQVGYIDAEFAAFDNLADKWLANHEQTKITEHAHVADETVTGDVVILGVGRDGRPKRQIGIEAPEDVLRSYLGRLKAAVDIEEEEDLF